jgi:hypothetical protein
VLGLELCAMACRLGCHDVLQMYSLGTALQARPLSHDRWWLKSVEPE